jgi:hypothetical protein
MAIEIPDSANNVSAVTALRGTQVGPFYLRLLGDVTDLLDCCCNIVFEVDGGHYYEPTFTGYRPQVVLASDLQLFGPNDGGKTYTFKVEDFNVYDDDCCACTPDIQQVHSIYGWYLQDKVGNIILAEAFDVPVTVTNVDDHVHIKPNFKAIVDSVGTVKAVVTAALFPTWITTTGYDLGELVTDPVTGLLYSCIRAHTSGATLEADLDAVDCCCNPIPAWLLATDPTA